MLAKIEEPLREAGLLKDPTEPPAWQFDGFAQWLIPHVRPMREIVVAHQLKLAGAPAFCPTYTKHVRCRGKLHKPRLYAAISGLLFMPRAIYESIDRRKAMFDLLGISGVLKGHNGLPLIASKDDIEKIKLLEAKLNIPPESKGTFFKVGQEVRFRDGSLWESWGGGTVIEIVDHLRIRVEGPKLFGSARTIMVPASELEAK